MIHVCNLWKFPRSFDIFLWYHIWHQCSGRRLLHWVAVNVMLSKYLASWWWEDGILSAPVSQKKLTFTFWLWTKDKTFCWSIVSNLVFLDALASPEEPLSCEWSLIGRFSNRIIFVSRILSNVCDIYQIISSSACLSWFSGLFQEILLVILPLSTQDFPRMNDCALFGEK